MPSTTEIQLSALHTQRLALAVAIIGAIMVIVQLRIVAKALLNTAYANSFAEIRELHKVFFSEPALRRFFYDEGAELDGLDVERQVEQRRVRVIAEMYLDSFIHLHLLRDRLSKDLRQLVDHYMEDKVQHSAALAAYLKENQELMPKKLRERVKGYIAERDWQQRGRRSTSAG